MSWYYNLYMKLASTKSRFGFTLVELMVVISIIGILSAIVYASFGTSRKIARDDIRKTDLKNLQVAIELYKAQNGRYPNRCPSGATYWSGNPKSGSFTCNTAGADFIVGLVPDFISVLPTDPSSSGSNVGYAYRVDSTGTSYKLMAFGSVETQIINRYSDDFARCQIQLAGSGCPDATPPANFYAVYKGSTAANW